MRRIVSGRAGHAATRVSARSAQVQALERHPVIGRADHRARTEQLVEAHLAMENVTADQAEAPLQVQGRMDLPTDDGRCEARRMTVHRRDTASAAFSRSSSQLRPGPRS